MIRVFISFLSFILLSFSASAQFEFRCQPAFQPDRNIKMDLPALVGKSLESESRAALLSQNKCMKSLCSKFGTRFKKCQTQVEVQKKCATIPYKCEWVSMRVSER